MREKIPTKIKNLILRQKSVKEEMADCMALSLIHLAAEESSISEIFKPIVENSINYLSQRGEEQYNNLQLELIFIKKAFSKLNKSPETIDLEKYAEIDASSCVKYFERVLGTLGRGFRRRS